MRKNIVHPPLPRPPPVYLNAGGSERNYGDKDVSRMTYYITDTNTDYGDEKPNKKSHKCILM